MPSNLASSICSALIGLSPASLSLPFLLNLIQLSSVCLGMLSALAAAALDWALSTSLTLSVLNSSVYLLRACPSLLVTVYRYPISEFNHQLCSTFFRGNLIIFNQRGRRPFGGFNISAKTGFQFSLQQVYSPSTACDRITG